MYDISVSVPYILLQLQDTRNTSIMNMTLQNFEATLQSYKLTKDNRRIIRGIMALAPSPSDSPDSPMLITDHSIEVSTLGEKIITVKIANVVWPDYNNCNDAVALVNNVSMQKVQRCILYVTNTILYV